MTETSTIRLVGLALPTFAGLRSAVLASHDQDNAVNTLREAGYAGGETVFDAFERWLAENEKNPVADMHGMPFHEFVRSTATFFRDAGWGEVTLSHDDDDDVAVIRIADCWEGDGAGCHVTTGMLAAFLGRVAGYSIAVLEVSCSVDGSCKFLIGNEDVMNHRWEMLQAG